MLNLFPTPNGSAMLLAGFPDNFPDKFFYFNKDIDDNFLGTPELSVTETLIILSSKFGISIKVAPYYRERRQSHS